MFDFYKTISIKLKNGFNSNLSYFIILSLCFLMTIDLVFIIEFPSATIVFCFWQKLYRLWRLRDQHRWEVSGPNDGLHKLDN